VLLIQYVHNSLSRELKIPFQVHIAVLSLIYHLVPNRFVAGAVNILMTMGNFFVAWADAGPWKLAWSTQSFLLSLSLVAPGPRSSWRIRRRDLASAILLPFLIPRVNISIA
jgi:hypothetical protein